MRKLTTEGFIERARKVHGDKYDYSQTKYVNARTKVRIYCPTHKEYFYQEPHSHLKGSGCNKCAVESCAIRQRLSTEEFIEKARKVHCDKYDYSKVEYLGAINKVCIYCPIHKKDFWQNASSHLSGAGCPECGKESLSLAKRSNTEEFMEKAKKIHGDKYDYSKVEYVNKRTKIYIICKKYGGYWQTPSNHLSGSSHTNSYKGLSKETVLSRFEKVHGDKYDYSLMEYKGMASKILIRCKKHNHIFEQTPGNHCSGYGCPICGYEKVARDLSLSWDEVLKRFINKHGEEFSYENFEYKNLYTPSLITCKKHGDFYQSAASHLTGAKHPNNAIITSKPELEIKEMIESMGYKTETNKRKYIKPYELDIFIPELNKAIEFNGKYWHYSDKFFRPGYHAMKSNLCRSKGINLLHIREDLWRKDKEKMKEIIVRFIKGGN